MIFILGIIKQGKYSRMQWRNPHVELILRRRIFLHVECECEPTVAHCIHLESVTLFLLSDALLINVSPLKSCFLLIHSQPPTNKPCRSRHFLNMFEKWVDLKVRVCSSRCWFEQSIMRRKTTFPLLVAERWGRPKHTVNKHATLDWVLVWRSELNLYSWQRDLNH